MGTLRHTQSQNIEMDPGGLSTLLSLPFNLPRPTWKTRPFTVVSDEITVPMLVRQCQVEPWGPGLEHSYLCVRLHYLRLLHSYKPSCAFSSSQVNEYPLRLSHSLFSPESSRFSRCPHTVRPNHPDALIPPTLGKFSQGIFRGGREKTFILPW